MSGQSSPSCDRSIGAVVNKNNKTEHIENTTRPPSCFVKIPELSVCVISWGLWNYGLKSGSSFLISKTFNALCHPQGGRKDCFMSLHFTMRERNYLITFEQFSYKSYTAMHMPFSKWRSCNLFTKTFGNLHKSTRLRESGSHKLWAWNSTMSLKFKGGSQWAHFPHFAGTSARFYWRSWILHKNCHVCQAHIQQWSWVWKQR